MGKTLNDLYDGIYSIAKKVVQKGGTITSSNISPSFNDIINGIESIPYAPVNLQGVANVILAEMPNTTIIMEDETGKVINTKTTNATKGGSVAFSVSEFGTYRFTAYNSEGVELWSKLFGVPSAGIYNCKVGKAFADYTDEEMFLAIDNDYAKFMWSVEDERTTTTMGSKLTWQIYGFNIARLADGSGEYSHMSLIMKTYTSASYKHYNSNVNNIGWEGSLIRQNGLAAGDVYYTRVTVDANTAGEFFAYDEMAKDWVLKTLPLEYDENEVYYTKNIVETDGAFLTGLPAWKDHIKQVEVPTADAGSGYKKIIISKDRVTIPSDGEVLGNSKRYSRYSQYELEGEQKDFFKNNYTDSKIRLGSIWWLRSPYSGNATTFCGVDGSGSVNYNNASSSIKARLVVNL